MTEEVNTMHLLAASCTETALQQVRQLLCKGASPRARESEGLTPLHVAAAYDNLAVCHLLLHFGADPVAKDDHGRTPIDLASGNAKRFLMRHVERNKRSQRNVLRRLFACHSTGARTTAREISRERPNISGARTTARELSRERRNASPSFIRGVKDRVRRSLNKFSKHSQSKLEEREDSPPPPLPDRIASRRARVSDAVVAAPLITPYPRPTDLSTPKHLYPKLTPVVERDHDDVLDPGTTPHSMHDVKKRAQAARKTRRIDDGKGNTSTSKVVDTPKRFRSRTPDAIGGAKKEHTTPRRSKTPDGRAAATRTSRTPKKIPSAPPLTPVSTRTPSPEGTKNCSKPIEDGDSTAYLTAVDDSFDADDLELRLKQLKISTPVAFVNESQLRRIRRLKDSELRDELKKCGVLAGPICSRTRRLYEKKLAEVKTATTELAGVKYSRPLEMCFKGRAISSTGAELDEIVRAEFLKSGVTAFCYLLVDPRKTLKNRSDMTFKDFVEAIFYVGKGTKARPFAHMIEARKMRDEHSPKLATNSKLQRIDSIWRGGVGVGSVELWHGISDNEAHIREAALIECIRLQNLTNIKGGSWHGVSKTWDITSRMDYGIFLLDQAYRQFLVMGSREIHSESLPDSVYPFVNKKKP